MTVPKTPVDKNGHVELRNDYVRRAEQPPIMPPETNSVPTEEPLDEPFRERIRSTYTAHQPTAFLLRERIRHCLRPTLSCASGTGTRRLTKESSGTGHGIGTRRVPLRAAVGLQAFEQPRDLNFGQVVYRETETPFMFGSEYLRIQGVRLALPVEVPRHPLVLFLMPAASRVGSGAATF